MIGEYSWNSLVWCSALANLFFFLISKEIKRLAPESFQESQVLIREKPTGERNWSVLGKLEKLVSELAYGWNEASNQENLVVDLVTDWKGSVNRKSPLYLKVFKEIQGDQNDIWLGSFCKWEILVRQFWNKLKKYSLQKYC